MNLGQGMHGHLTQGSWVQILVKLCRYSIIIFFICQSICTWKLICKRIFYKYHFLMFCHADCRAPTFNARKYLSIQNKVNHTIKYLHGHRDYNEGSSSRDNWSKLLGLQSHYAKLHALALRVEILECWQADPFLHNSKYGRNSNDRRHDPKTSCCG